MKKYLAYERFDGMYDKIDPNQKNKQKARI